ncbi:PKD domain-containing protein [Haloferula helveola]|uniref:PKD domain-containing protein n=2 Tax=Haloferula helveola TaxID=490095 RepID=A0ABM7R9K2_9BACT|nr:PKD domain-containing protein [Haloferula helveola]
MLLGVFGTLGLTLTAAAQTPVPITNAGFEDPVLPSDNDLGDPTGWSSFGSPSDDGSWNPGIAAYPAEAPEGTNVAYVYGGVVDAGLSQVLAGGTGLFQADANYSLSVEVGQSNSYLFDGYRVQLLAGGTLLAEDDNTLSPAAGTFVTSTVNYTYDAGDAALVGQPLEIRLLAKGQSGGSNGETDFDDVQLTATLTSPIANAGGPYTVPISGSLSLDGSGSLPPDGQSITTYEWDLDNDGDYDELISGATPASIPYGDLQSTYGMVVGANTIKLRVTDDSSPTPKTSTAEGTVTLAAPVAGQLGILDLNANGGINPNTGNPWQVGDKYRLAFYTSGTTAAQSNDPDYYNDFATSEAWQASNLKGTYWRAMVTVNLDSATTQALSPKSEAKANTGTGDLTGGTGAGGAGEPVYVVNGTTCIARNNADIWNSWSNPFAGDAVIRIASGSTNLNSDGNPVTASQNVHYSPYLNQFGLGDSANIHGVDVATGCSNSGSHVNALGDTTDNTNYNNGSSNANNTSRVWNRFTQNNTTSLRVYAISVPLTIVDLAETVAPSVVSLVDDRAGADLNLGAASVVYTVTFSEPIDAETLTTADFGNAGTAGFTVDTIRGTLDSSVFEVTVTPTTAGTLQLQVLGGAVIEDPVGNAVDTGSPINDDTTITVIDDNTAPTLVSIVDNVSGGPIVATQTATPTYTVTFDEAIEPSSLTTDDFENGGTAGVTIDSVSSTGDPAVFQVAVTTSTAGTLILQIAAGAVVEDLSANALDTGVALPDDTTITVNPAPELAGQLGVLDVVNANGGINPVTGLAWAAGDTYRLIFLTSQTTDATSTDIATYNTFVQGVAAASSTYPDLGNGSWKIVASTETVDARDNTGTNPGSGTGVAVFLMDGVTKAANDNADFWDGFIENTVSLDENASALVENRVFTGSNFNGTSVGTGGGDKPLGVLDGDGVRTGQSDSNQFWFVQWKENGNNLNSVYALSEPLTIISTAAGSPYDTWTGGFPGLSDPSPEGDDDGGGLQTGIEWVVGGDPSDGSDDAGLAPTFDNTSDPDFFIFTYLESDDAEADGFTSIAVQYGNDLVGWTDAVHDGTDIIITETELGAVDSVEVKLRRSAFEMDGRLFARLQVLIAVP